MRRRILQFHLGLHCLIRPVYPTTYGNTLKIAGLVENRLDADDATFNIFIISKFIIENWLKPKKDTKCSLNVQ